jgi:hypothetical protein
MMYDCIVTMYEMLIILSRRLFSRSCLMFIWMLNGRAAKNFYELIPLAYTKQHRWAAEMVYMYLWNGAARWRMNIFRWKFHDYLTYIRENTIIVVAVRHSLCWWWWWCRRRAQRDVCEKFFEEMVLQCEVLVRNGCKSFKSWGGMI